MTVGIVTSDLDLTQLLRPPIPHLLPQACRRAAADTSGCVPGNVRVLGTDGFGRSDTRTDLRRFFEVDRHYIAVAALKELADTGAIEPARVQQAIERYGLDAEAPDPTTV